MISVVIPTSNSERLLPRCFDSLITAAVRGGVLEVIVADGGSSDETLAIADAAGLGTIEIKAMQDHGYDTEFAVGVTAASA